MANKLSTPDWNSIFERRTVQHEMNLTHMDGMELSDIIEELSEYEEYFKKENLTAFLDINIGDEEPLVELIYRKKESDAVRQERIAYAVGNYNSKFFSNLVNKKKQYVEYLKLKEEFKHTLSD